MAKTIEEILKDLQEWQEENQKERCVLLIAGYENEDISLKAQGNKANILTCVASAMADSDDFRNLIISTLEHLIKYESQEEEE